VCLLQRFQIISKLILLIFIFFTAGNESQGQLKQEFPPRNWLQAWTFITHDGKIAFSARLDGPGMYKDGFVVVDSKLHSNEPCRKLIIDKRGNPLVPFLFFDARPASDGFFVVTGPATPLHQTVDARHNLIANLPESKQSFLSTKGQLWTKCFNKCGDFSNGIAMVHNYHIEKDQSDSGPFFLINTKGEVVKKLECVPITVLLSFYDGMQAAKPSQFNTGPYGYINTRGEFMIPCTKLAGQFKEGFARAQTKHGWIYVDHSGQKAFPFCFDDDFHEGLAKVRAANVDKFIDKTGAVVVSAPNSNTSYGDFSDGLASYSDESVCGFINRTGKVVFKAPFVLNSSYHEGLRREATSTNADSKEGFKNKSGNWVIAPKFLQTYDFSEGLAAVRLEK
jgi:hypothetical protein